MTAGVAGQRAELELSVVLACDGAADQVAAQIADRLGALELACAGLAAEVLVVHASQRPVTLPPRGDVPTSGLAAPSTLVPILWGRGIAEARGRIVALTTTQFRVQAGWARALLAGLSSGLCSGVGGRMALAPGASAVTRAVFLIRYSEHMGPAGAPEPRDIAGDNAAYVREQVLRVCPDAGAGFWEVDVHRLLRAHGTAIGRAADAVAEFAPRFTLREMLINRFEHGSHFGAYRVRTLGWPRWRAVAVTPLVPAVLLARAVGRARRAGQPLGSVLTLLPAMILLLAAWAAGEGHGAMWHSRGSVRA